MHKCRVGSSLPPWLGFIAWAMHAVRTQCNNLAIVLSRLLELSAADWRAIFPASLTFFHR